MESIHREESLEWKIIDFNIIAVKRLKKYKSFNEFELIKLIFKNNNSI